MHIPAGCTGGVGRTVTRGGRGRGQAGGGGRARGGRHDVRQPVLVALAQQPVGLVHHLRDKRARRGRASARTPGRGPWLHAAQRASAARQTCSHACHMCRASMLLPSHCFSTCSSPSCFLQGGKARAWSRNATRQCSPKLARPECQQLASSWAMPCCPPCAGAGRAGSAGPRQEAQMLQRHARRAAQVRHEPARRRDEHVHAAPAAAP